MKRYKEYKDSGIEWIGEIPKHWEAIKLKFIGEAFIGITYSPDDIVENCNEGLLVLRSSNIQNGKLSLEDCVYVKKQIQEKAITKFGDILICSRNGSRALIGKNILIDKHIEGVTFGAFMTIYRTNFSNYAYWFFNSQVFIGQSSLFLSSTINQLTVDTLNNFQIAIPSVDEQIKITTYLDRKTKSIDLLIEKKKKIIDLLKEERAAVINHSVTEGINPNEEMKDSGIEWLGEIPKHWEMTRIKYVVSKIGSGITPKGGADVYQTSGIALLRSQNVHFTGLKLDDVAYISEEIHKSMSNSEIFEGDVLLNITGASIGRCYYVDKKILPANVNQHVCILRPNELILTKYLFIYISSFSGQMQIDYCQTGSNREGLNFEQISNFQIPLPTIIEQKQIIDITLRKVQFIDTSIEKISQEISLIEEYRTALINEAVTGKICVLDKIKSKKAESLVTCK